MCSMKFVLLGFLILGVCHTVLSKSFSSLVDDDYQYDLDNNDERNSDQTTNAPPYFETSEYNKSAKVGDNITIECDVKNLAASDVVIWFNKTTLLTQSKLSISRDSRISVDSNYSLRINGVRGSDTSQYYCEIVPSQISMKVNLEVDSKPTAIIVDKDGHDISGGQMTYRQGDRIEIECRATGNPPPQINWFSNAVRVASGNDVLVNYGFLIIKHADHEHAKLYQCLADNGYGVSHASLSISVHLMPTTTEQVPVAVTDNCTFTHSHSEPTTTEQVAKFSTKEN